MKRSLLLVLILMSACASPSPCETLTCQMAEVRSEQIRACLSRAYEEYSEEIQAGMIRRLGTSCRKWVDAQMRRSGR